jgi:predicted CXXCH cytochrome family protein
MNMKIIKQYFLTIGMSVSWFAVLSFFFLASLLAGSEVRAAGSSHLDKIKVKNSCSACHSPHGRRQTAALRKHVPDLCFDCHGPGATIDTIASGDVYVAQQKRYAHPIKDTSRYHSASEDLSDKNVFRPRHVSCLDCHNPHKSSTDKPVEGVRGISAQGVGKRAAERMTEVCYKCHGDDPGRHFSSPDTLSDFDPSLNASYHPVEKTALGRSESMAVSLQGITIECTDCHEPHGSDNRFMLLFNYNDSDGSESQYAYELCYSCHRRESILSNQSFRLHKRHILYASISCASCHSAHSSRDNPSLIDLDNDVVRPNNDGMLFYSKTGRENECFLNCHDVEHIGGSIKR